MPRYGANADSRLEFSYSIDEKLSHDVPRFLNRLLGMPLATQRYLFDYFSATLDATIKVC